MSDHQFRLDEKDEKSPAVLVIKNAAGRSAVILVGYDGQGFANGGLHDEEESAVRAAKVIRDWAARIYWIERTKRV